MTCSQYVGNVSNPGGGGGGPAGANSNASGTLESWLPAASRISSVGRGRCCSSVEGAFGGDEGRVVDPPSSWAMASVSPGDEDFKRFLALVTLWEMTGLQPKVAATAPVAAAVAAAPILGGLAAIWAYVAATVAGLYRGCWLLDCSGCRCPSLLLACCCSEEAAAGFALRDCLKRRFFSTRFWLGLLTFLSFFCPVAAAVAAAIGRL